MTDELSIFEWVPNVGGAIILMEFGDLLLVPHPTSSTSDMMSEVRDSVSDIPDLAGG